MVKDITCISLLPTSPPLQKNKKNEEKNATNLQVLRNRSTCTYDIGVGNGKYPTP